MLDTSWKDPKQENDLNGRSCPQNLDTYGWQSCVIFIIKRMATNSNSDRVLIDTAGERGCEEAMNQWLRSVDKNAGP